MAIKKVCPRCGKLHDIGSKCYIGQKPKDTEARRFRNSRKWQKKAVEIKERDGYMCIYCKEQGRFIYQNLEVHHITPLHEDISKGFDDDNLATLCQLCHKRAEKGEITRKELQDIIERHNEKR